MGSLHRRFFLVIHGRGSLGLTEARQERSGHRAIVRSSHASAVKRGSSSRLLSGPMSVSGQKLTLLGQSGFGAEQTLHWDLEMSDS